MSYINIDSLNEEDREKFKPYIHPECNISKIGKIEIDGGEFTIHTMRKEVFEKLEKIRVILEDNKIKLTTDEMLN